MKFHDENDDTINRITAYDENSITINEIAHRESLIVLRNHIIAPWPVQNSTELTRDHLTPLLEHAPQIVIIGTGGQAKYELGDWAKALVEMSIGFEVMSTSAACRTFNIVAGEGRNAAAALIIEKASEEGRNR